MQKPTATCGHHEKTGPEIRSVFAKYTVSSPTPPALGTH